MSVLSRRGLLVPLRIGLEYEDGAYIPNPTLTAVEPPASRILELGKLRGFPGRLMYHASRNRQCHTYAVTERRDARSLALKRVFSRYLMIFPHVKRGLRQHSPYQFCMDLALEKSELSCIFTLDYSKSLP